MDERRPTRSSRRKRRSSAAPVVAGIGAVLVVGLLVLGGCVLSRMRSPQPAAVTSAPEATPTTAPSAEASSPVAIPTTATAADATPSAGDPSAVKAAAVPYPGAPAVKPETIRKVDTHGRKLVAITLDDGIPFDTRILDLFESRGVRCTTFLLGQAVKAHPDLMKRLNADGFEIANHTWDHKTLTKLSDGQVRSELERTQASISAITGNQAPFMRPPGGATNARVKELAGSMGYRVVLWNHSFADTSKAATVQRIYHNVMDHLAPGDIILCHWGGKHNYEALKLILPEMERRGFTPVTVSELLAAEKAGE